MPSELVFIDQLYNFLNLVIFSTNHYHEKASLNNLNFLANLIIKEWIFKAGF
jgi:hypothetical protein